MAEAAVGNRAILARAIEKINLSVPQGGFYDYIYFDAMDFGRFAPENKSTAITGSEGSDKGTPGTIDFKGSLKYDLTPDRLLFDVVAMTGKPTASAVLTAALSWLVKIRPRRQGTGSGENEPRAATFYVNEGQGSSYSSSLQYGRRCHDITLTDAANQRVKVDAEYSVPTGETISALAIAKTGNTGTFVGVLSSRGRRDPFGADYTGKKSVFIKVISIAVGPPIVATVSAVVATAGDGTGGGFPATYDTATFTVSGPSTTTGSDGFSTVILDLGPLGLFGENNEPYEVSFGTSLTGLAASDQFEIPVSLGVIATSPATGSRLSSFHLVRSLAENYDVRFDKGTTKFTRPYKPYYVNGRRLPLSIDPSGDVMATEQFSKRLFDRRFRNYNDAATRFSIHDKYQIGSTIAGTTVDRETVEVWMPQCAVQSDTAGNVSNKEVQEETVNLMAEQPGVGAPSAPSGFDGGYAWEMNIVTSLDPSSLS